MGGADPGDPRPLPVPPLQQPPLPAAGRRGLAAAARGRPRRGHPLPGAGRVLPLPRDGPQQGRHLRRGANRFTCVLLFERVT